MLQQPHATNALAYYQALVVQALEAHPAAHRVNWSDTMRDLRAVGLEPSTRTFEIAGFDDEACDDLEIQICFPPRGGSTNEVIAVCSCDESTNNYHCRHTYAGLQLAAKILQRPQDQLSRFLAASPAQAPKPQAVSAVAPRLLNALDQVLRVAENPAETSPALGQRRLAYRIQIKRTIYGPSITVLPCEQELKKDGSAWKRGRALSWDQLRFHRELANGPHDEAVRELVNRTGYSPYAYNGPPTSAVLAALAGCTRVSLEDEHGDHPVMIRTGALSLTCGVENGNLKVYVTCNGEMFDFRNGLLSDGNSSSLIAVGLDTLMLITAPNQQSLMLATEFIKTPVSAPLAEATPLIERLSKLDGIMPVKFSDELVAEPIVADPRIHLELLPGQPQGLYARFRVRPLPDGAFAMPGDPRVGSYGTLGGKISRVQRDRVAERERALGILKELELPQSRAVSEWDWRFTSDEATIDFLAKVFDRQRQRCGQQATNTVAADELGQIPATDDLVVTWPQGGSIRVAGEIDSSSLRMSVEDRDDWFGLDGTVEVDGHIISLRSLISALKSGRKYISLGNGLWVRISDEFLERLQAIGDLVHSTKNGLEVDITAAPALQDLVQLREHFQLCAKWQNLLNNLDAKAIQCAAPPKSLNAELRHYQLDGYRWLKRLSTWGVGGCLADDMGLGKTVQALAVLLDRRETGPALVIAPMSVGFNWVRETQRFAPSLRVISYRDSDRGQVLQDVHASDVVVVSYALFQRDAEKFGATDWGTLVLDEAQNVKNPTTKTARAVRDLKAKWRLALTGTPIENRLSELWALFRAISPGVFGSWERFRDRFAAPIEKGKDPAKRQSLARLVKPFILRRTKEEVLKELPPRTEIQHTIELSSEERKRYEDARLAICTQLAGLDFNASGNDQRFTVLAAITRLRQLACHPRLVDAKWTKSSAKLDTFMELVEELREEGHRALVFSQFTQHLDLARKALDRIGVSYQYLDGSSSAVSRQRSVDAFQAGRGDLFLISLKAGGSGLNLTAADYVIHLDPWWNPAVEDQATDRAHRIGQLRPVTVYRLVTEGTIEEKILALHERKRELVASVLDGTDEAAQLSTEELVDLIKGGSTPSELSDDEAPTSPKRRKSSRSKAAR